MRVDAIRAALSGPASDLDLAVKSAVTQGFEAVDPEVSVGHTEYFNHTFVPDLVVYWGRKPDHTVRHVYLRRRTTDEGIIADVETLGTSRPIFLGLDNPPHHTWSPAISEALRSRPQTLVTEPGAFEAFVPSDRGHIEDTLGSAVVRGGRGLLDQDDASDIRGVISTALRAPDEANRQDFVRVLGELSNNLLESYAARFRRYLRFVWFLAGGSQDEFPWETDAGSLAPEDLARLLKYLFTLDAIDDDSFWERLASHLDLSIFTILRDQPPNPNLDRLVRAAGQNLVGKYAAIVRWLDEASAPFRWHVRDGFLQISSGDSLEMRFAYDGSRFARVPEVPGPTVDDVLDRLDDRPLRSIKTEDRTYRINIEALGAEPIGDIARRTLVDDLGRSSRVKEIEANVAGHRSTVDFARRRLSADGPLTVQRLAVEAARLLLGLDEAEIGRLKDFLGEASNVGFISSPRTPTIEPSLFDYIEDQDSLP